MSPLRWTTEPRRSLVEEFFDTWACWREACEDVTTAYRRWNISAKPQRALAFESYRAALEREEYAARVHSRSSELVHAGSN
jgi:hypothetical protein